MSIITLEHGSGGKISHKLVQDIFFKHFKNDILDRADDSAVLDISSEKIAFTTDTFVVKPIFFPGGDIGKIAVCGTVNDLAVAGARPKYMSCGFILEEGFPEKDLEKIVISMSEWAKKAGVSIVTGDTKVVARGEADKIFINTSGVGVFGSGDRIGIDQIEPGDKIIITGTVGDHGVAVLGERKGLEFESEIYSDCAPLNDMLDQVMCGANGVKFMRDPTRGGLATTLNEITDSSNLGIIIEEKNVPIKEAVKGACELLGLDPLYIANEGKAVLITAPECADKVIDILKKNEYGKDACIIGEVTEENPRKVCLKTRYGVTRIVGMLTGEQLPRIC
ncbi:MAG: hydrogenase expression/formation protein HypE [Candidatus Aadella gelida]|nr:hydrogenase expression/formation protein HypE [Candidatus Aadella gelida]